MKKPPSFNVNIPKPCHEKWDEMSPNDKGRFCGSCQKTVVDFTGMTNAEVRNFFIEKPKPVCGQFKKSQLRKYFIPVPAKEPRRVSSFVFGSIAVLAAASVGFPKAPLAQTPIHTAVHENSDFVEIELGEVEDVAIDELILTGRVIDNRDRLHWRWPNYTWLERQSKL